MTTTMDAFSSILFDDDSKGKGETIKIAPVVYDESNTNNQLSYYNLGFEQENNNNQTTAAETGTTMEPRTVSPSTSTANTSNTIHDILKEQRDPKNGAMTFKANTEYDLLMHIQNGLRDDIVDYNDVDSSNAILHSIDLYCLGKQWMFHVGHDKGLILEKYLHDCIDEFKKLNSNNSNSNNQPLIIVDLGTYCGYSAILLAKTVREYAPDLQFHIYSTEINNEMIQIAKTLIQMSKLSDYITIIKLDHPKYLSKSLKQYISGKIDYLFLDHAKDWYLPDLLSLEKNNFVKKGTRIVADNVLYYNNLEKYRRYVRDLSKNGNIVETQMIEMKLEYSDDKDGIELTKYLQDPPVGMNL